METTEGTENTEKLKYCDEELVEKLIGAAIQVHKELGPGLLESVYELALMIELADMDIDARRQVEIPAFYKDRNLGTGFRAEDRKSTRLNSSHSQISYAGFCLKKQKKRTC